MGTAMSVEAKKGIRKDLLIVLGTVIGISIVGFLIFVILTTRLSGDYIDRIAFDAEVWRQGETTARQDMLDDLLQNHSPIGLTHQEVIDLLGERSKTHHFSEYDLVYWIGPERPFMGDSEWFVIRFDEKDFVVEVAVFTD